MGQQEGGTREVNEGGKDGEGKKGIVLAIGADGHVVLASATAALVGLSPPCPNTPHLT